MKASAKLKRKIKAKFIRSLMTLLAIEGAKEKGRGAYNFRKRPSSK